MGDLWFASRVAGGGGSAVINGETIDDKGPCLLAEGDNRLQLGGGNSFGSARLMRRRHPALQ